MNEQRVTVVDSLRSLTISSSRRNNTCNCFLICSIAHSCFFALKDLSFFKWFVELIWSSSSEALLLWYHELICVLLKLRTQGRNIEEEEEDERIRWSWEEVKCIVLYSYSLKLSITMSWSSQIYRKNQLYWFCYSRN